LFGARHIGYHAETHAVNAAQMHPVEVVEGVPVAAPCPLHQFGIGARTSRLHERQHTRFCWAR
jgi:hypothetical protein